MLIDGTTRLEKVGSLLLLVIAFILLHSKTATGASIVVPGGKESIEIFKTDEEAKKRVIDIANWERSQLLKESLEGKGLSPNETEAALKDALGEKEILMTNEAKDSNLRPPENIAKPYEKSASENETAPAYSESNILKFNDGIITDNGSLIETSDLNPGDISLVPLRTEDLILNERFNHSNLQREIRRSQGNQNNDKDRKSEEQDKEENNTRTSVSDNNIIKGESKVKSMETDNELERIIGSEGILIENNNSDSKIHSFMPKGTPTSLEGLILNENKFNKSNSQTDILSGQENQSNDKDEKSEDQDQEGNNTRTVEPENDIIREESKDKSSETDNELERIIDSEGILIENNNSDSKIHSFMPKGTPTSLEGLILNENKFNKSNSQTDILSGQENQSNDKDEKSEDQDQEGNNTRTVEPENYIIREESKDKSSETDNEIEGIIGKKDILIKNNNLDSGMASFVPEGTPTSFEDLILNTNKFNQSNSQTDIRNGQENESNDKDQKSEEKVAGGNNTGTGVSGNEIIGEELKAKSYENLYKNDEDKFINTNEENNESPNEVKPLIQNESNVTSELTPQTDSSQNLRAPKTEKSMYEEMLLELIKDRQNQKNIGIPNEDIQADDTIKSKNEPLSETPPNEKSVEVKEEKAKPMIDKFESIILPSEPNTFNAPNGVEQADKILHQDNIERLGNKNDDKSNVEEQIEKALKDLVFNKTVEELSNMQNCMPVTRNIAHENKQDINTVNEILSKDSQENNTKRSNTPQNIKDKITNSDNENSDFDKITNEQNDPETIETLLGSNKNLDLDTSPSFESKVMSDPKETQNPLAFKTLPIPQMLSPGQAGINPYEPKTILLLKLNNQLNTDEVGKNINLNNISDELPDIEKKLYSNKIINKMSNEKEEIENQLEKYPINEFEDGNDGIQENTRTTEHRIKLAAEELAEKILLKPNLVDLKEYTLNNEGITSKRNVSENNKLMKQNSCENGHEETTVKLESIKEGLHENNSYENITVFIIGEDKVLNATDSVEPSVLNEHDDINLKSPKARHVHGNQTEIQLEKLNNTYMRPADNESLEASPANLNQVYVPPPNSARNTIPDEKLDVMKLSEMPKDQKLIDDTKILSMISNLSSTANIGKTETEALVDRINNKPKPNNTHSENKQGKVTNEEIVNCKNNGCKNNEVQKDIKLNILESITEDTLPCHMRENKDVHENHCPGVLSHFPPFVKNASKEDNNIKSKQKLNELKKENIKNVSDQDSLEDNEQLFTKEVKEVNNNSEENYNSRETSREDIEVTNDEKCNAPLIAFLNTKTQARFCKHSTLTENCTNSNNDKDNINFKVAIKKKNLTENQSPLKNTTGYEKFINGNEKNNGSGILNRIKRNMNKTLISTIENEIPDVKENKITNLKEKTVGHNEKFMNKINSSLEHDSGPIAKNITEKMPVILNENNKTKGLPSQTTNTTSPEPKKEKKEEISFLSSLFRGLVSLLKS